MTIQETLNALTRVWIELNGPAGDKTAANKLKTYIRWLGRRWRLI